MSASAIQPTYSIPVSNGIFAHCQTIGNALWVFLWLIDHTTKESTGLEGELEGLVFGGLPVRSSQIAGELGIATRTVHEHIERLCHHGYIRRIDNGDGLPAGYAVRRSKKWKRNQTLSATLNAEETGLAENRAPSQESAHPRGNTVGVRGNPRYPRGNPLPIRKTVHNKTEQTTIAGTTDCALAFGEEVTHEQLPTPILVPAADPVREAVERAFAVYCVKLGRSERRYALTPLRRQKAEARLRERMQEHLGDVQLAEEDLAQAIANLAADEFCVTRGYTDWIDQLFKSREEFEKRLNRMQPATSNGPRPLTLEEKREKRERENQLRRNQ